jgi:ubiquinone/menaquinone biosynthesis C-methylase UbiE
MTAAKIPRRILWAVQQLSVDPDDDVLEIGCGVGIAASLICSRLANGHLTAIDRSESMIDAARRRNRAYIESGKVSFSATSLAEADFGSRHFNKALAVNVNLFWLKPAVELAILKKALRPRGEICLVFQPPVSSKIEPITEACARSLLQHGFADIRMDIEELQPITVVSIRAKSMLSKGHFSDRATGCSRIQTLH